MLSHRSYGQLTRFGLMSEHHETKLLGCIKLLHLIVDRTKRSTVSSAETISSLGKSSISTAVIQDIADKLKTQQYRGSTKTNYYFVWRKFNEFFVKSDVKPATWEERLILFVGYLIDKQLKSTTIRCYISAIKAVLREDGETLNENTYLLKSLTKACQLKMIE